MKDRTISVDGVYISLTPDQLAEIEKIKAKRRRECNSFTKVLLHFGFKKSKDVKGGFVHETFDWWAQIDDYTNFKMVFMVGNGLRSGCHGGSNYGEPREIEEEITRFLDAQK